MSLASGLLCTRCESEHPLDGAIRSCPSCGGVLWVRYEFSRLKGIRGEDVFEKEGFNIWRYRALLPVLKASSIVSLGEGWTFLHKSEGLARELGLKQLYIKDETTNPTGSFIDRGVSVEISMAKGFGCRAVLCATTGNLGASAAAYAAKAGLRCKIVIPPRVDLGKLYQMIAYGAEVETKRSYEQALLKADAMGNGYHVITPSSPYFLEGLKTTAYETCEQLGWEQPDWMVVPMGNGGHLSMIWKGLNELASVGIIDSVRTRLVGVQAKGAAPIVAAYQKEEGDVKPAGRADTLAVDIGIRRPSAGYLAVRAIRGSGGRAVVVSDEDIIEAIGLLARNEGIFAEPAATSTVAALRSLVDTGVVDRTDKIVCVITGMGLKDPVTARRLIERPKHSDRMPSACRGKGYMIRPGGTKLKILRLLSGREMYGYEIRKELKQKANVDLKLPTVYEHLLELERRGLIERTKACGVAGRRERHYYTLTGRGKALLRP